MQLARSGWMLENPHSFSPSAVRGLLLLVYLISLSTFCLLEFYPFSWSHVKPTFKVIFPRYRFTTVVFHKFYWLCLLIRRYYFTLKFLFYFRVKSVFLYFIWFFGINNICMVPFHTCGSFGFSLWVWVYFPGCFFFFNELYFICSIS